jgi:hypothetical protein
MDQGAEAELSHVSGLNPRCIISRLGICTRWRWKDKFNSSVLCLVMYGIVINLIVQVDHLRAFDVDRRKGKTRKKREIMRGTL